LLRAQYIGSLTTEIIFVEFIVLLFERYLAGELGNYMHFTQETSLLLVDVPMFLDVVTTIQAQQNNTFHIGTCTPSMISS